MSKSISKNEVGEHNTPEKGLWIIIDDGVYDVTGERLSFVSCLPFQPRNPGLRAGAVVEIESPSHFARSVC
jgi:hypothetical protein